MAALNQYLNTLTYEEIIEIFTDFLLECQSQVFTTVAEKKDEVYQKKMEVFLRVGQKYFQGEISKEELTEKRVEAWQLHDRQKEPCKKRAYLRAVLCCMYPEDFEDPSLNDPVDKYEWFEFFITQIGEKHVKELQRYMRQQQKNCCVTKNKLN